MIKKIIQTINMCIKIQIHKTLIIKIKNMININKKTNLENYQIIQIILVSNQKVNHSS